MNNIIMLKGTDYENDKRIIEENINSNPIFVLDNKNTKLYQYIDYLHDDMELKNTFLDKLRICKQLDFYGKVKLYSENRVELGAPGTTEEVLKFIDPGTKYRLVVKNVDNEESKREGRNLLANIVQQLIYIDYPLTEVDFKLETEYADADKTVRFMERLDTLRNAANSASNVIANIIIDNSNIDEESRKRLLDTRQNAQDSYNEIAEQIKKVRNTEMKIAVAASKKTGKSVIVNCMLETELAPTSLEMATPNTCIYKVSDDSLYHLTLGDLKDGQRQDFNDSKSLYKKISEVFKAAENNQAGGYTCPDMLIEYVNNGNHFNDENFKIYDTPGPNFAGAAHHKSTEKAIDECDVAIFAIDYSKFLTTSEEAFLKKVKEIFTGKNKFHTLIFVLNKMDLALADKGTKCRAKSIDFIRNRLGEINEEYRNCIVFGTSAQDYFYTLELEKAIENNSELSLLKEGDLYTNLRSCMAQVPPGDMRELLSNLDAEAGKLVNQLGYGKVDIKDIQLFSGIPQLIDYVAYIAKSKARDEILNSITYKIDEQSRKLAEIVKEVPNIEKLMGKNEEEMDRIARILKEYSEDAAKILSTDELTAQDGRSIYSGGISAAEINYLGGYPVNIKEIISTLSQHVKNLSVEDIEREIWGEFLRKYKSKIIELNGTIVPLNELNKIAERFLAQALGTYRDRMVAGRIRDEENNVQEFKDDLQNVLAARQKRLKELSEECRQKLKKENCPLDLPEIPTFNVSIPDNIVTNLEKLEVEVRYTDLNGGFYNKLWPIHKFFRNIFTHHDINYSGNDVTVEGSFTDRDEAKLKVSVHNALVDGKVVKQIKDNDLEAISKCVKEAADKVLDEFTNMNKESDKRIKKFSELVDDTDYFLKKQIGFEQLKALIGDIEEASKEFMEIWNFVLTDTREGE